MLLVLQVLLKLHPLLLCWSVLVLGELLEVELLETSRLIHKRLSLLLRKIVPSSPQLLRDGGVVDGWVVCDHPPPLVVGEHHERIHRSLDVVRRVLLCLKGE